MGNLWFELTGAYYKSVKKLESTVSNIISNNTLLYSDVAIDLLGCESNIVSNNYCYKQKINLLI